MKRLSQKKGSLVVSMAWVLVSLSVLSVALMQYTQVCLISTRRSLGKLRARYFAEAGVLYACDRIAKGSFDVKIEKEIATSVNDSFVIEVQDLGEDRSRRLDSVKIRVVGEDGLSKERSTIEIIIRKRDLSVLFWQRS